MKPVFDFVLAFVTAVGSSIDANTKAVRVSTTGIGDLTVGTNGDFAIGLNDEDGELADDQEVYGALGLLARPPDPETIGGKDFRAEALAARTADGLVPFAWRDLRLDRFFPNGLPKGSVRLVGYGGAFYAVDSDGVGDARTDTQTLYLPYDFVGGVPSKAHAIVLQPNGDDGITLTHGDGYQVALTSDGILMRTSDTETFFIMREGEITLSAAKIFTKGTLYVGQSAEAGLPLLAGILSQPCPSLFLSPV